MGVEMSHGEYIAFVDCDHCISPDFVSKMLEGFCNDDNVGIVSCQHSTIQIKDNYKYNKDFDNNTTYTIIPPEDYSLKMWSEHISREIWGKLYKREVLIANQFRTDRLYAGFSFFWNITNFILSEKYKLVVLSAPLYVYRKNSFFKHVLHCSPNCYMEEIFDYRRFIEECHGNRLLFNSIITDYIKVLFRTIHLTLTLGPDAKPNYWLIHNYICSIDRGYLTKALDKNEYKSLLKIRYLPHLYYWLRTQRIKRSEFSSKKPDNPSFPLGEKLEALALAKAGSSHLKYILIYLHKNVWIYNDATYITHMCQDHNYFEDTIKNNHGKIIRFTVYMDPFRRVVSTYMDKIRGTENYLYFYSMGLGKQTSFAKYMKQVRKELHKKDPLTIDIHCVHNISLTHLMMLI